MKRYKLIVMVHAFHNELYNYFRKKYLELSEYPDVKIFFVYGESGKNLADQTDRDIVYLDIDESKISPGMIFKTIRSFEFIDNNFDYDFLIKISASTILLFDRLLEFLETVEKNNMFGGPYAEKRNSPRSFARGCAMLFSRNVVKSVIEQQNLIYNNYDINSVGDDCVLSWFVEDYLKIKPVRLNRKMELIENRTQITQEEINSSIKSAIDKQCVFFRVKNRNRLQVDTQIFDQIFKTYYLK